MASMRVLRSAASLLVILVAAAALVVLPARTAGAREATVSIEFFAFDPDTLAIQTGTTVIWVNDEMLNYPVIQGTHRIVADDGSFDSGPLAPRQRFSFDFLDPGAVSYLCSIHPQLMRGSIEVTGPPVRPPDTERTVRIVEPSRSDIDTWGYDPADLEVEAGTTVTWRNEGTEVHTVTADDGSFDSGELAPGETFARTFDEAVSVRYHCDPHPWMEGVLRIAGAPAPPPPPSAPRGGVPPPPVQQPPRVGEEPATWNVLAVEPSSSPTSWGFEPASLTIRAGDTIVWRNAGAVAHTVTADDGSFDSGDLAAGETFTRTFAEAATIRFHCTPHPWMTGTIQVVAAAAGEPLPPPPPAPEPAPRPPEGTPAPQPRAPTPIDPDPAAAIRTPLAVGTGGVVLLLGLVLVLPTLLERLRRRDAGVDADATQEPEREPISTG